MTIDWVTMLGNLSRSLYPIQKLISGFAYLLGIAMITGALMGFKKAAEQGRHGHDKRSHLVALLVIGAALIFLPSTLDAVSNTFFGLNSALSYINYSPYDINSIMQVLLRTAGVLWFVRGCVLLVQAGEPGTKKHGSKGLTFIFAGILAMNLEATVNVLTYTLNELILLTAHK